MVPGVFMESLAGPKHLSENLGVGRERRPALPRGTFGGDQTHTRWPRTTGAPARGLLLAPGPSWAGHELQMCSHGRAAMRGGHCRQAWAGSSTVRLPRRLFPSGLGSVIGGTHNPSCGEGCWAHGVSAEASLSAGAAFHSGTATGPGWLGTRMGSLLVCHARLRFRGTRAACGPYRRSGRPS